MIEEAPLARWTPVALSAGAGALSIDWGDLRGVRFAEPFFHQTVERWAGSGTAALARTSLRALEALDGAPSLDPSAIIFHVSRCGSTLLSRLLGSVPGMVAVSEPAPLNALLLAEEHALDGLDRVAALRLMVRALGRRRFGDERHYVLKLSSWNIMRLDLFRRAFPGAALIWLMREPGAVVASLLADPPGWLGTNGQAVFGFADPPHDAKTFCVRAVAAMLEAASTLGPEAMLLDYADLPDAAWTSIARRLGLALEADDIARMVGIARLRSKEVDPRPFEAKTQARQPLNDTVRDSVAAAALPIYNALFLRRNIVRD